MKRSEHGFVVAEWVAAVAFLLIPTLWLVLSVAAFPERIGMAQLAADEAGKQIVQSNGTTTADLQTDAIQTVKDVLIANMKLHDDAAHPKDQDFLSKINSSTVAVQSFDKGGSTVDGLSPGGTVTVTVDLPTPLVLTGNPATAFCCKRAHTEPVDNYRSFGP